MKIPLIDLSPIAAGKFEDVSEENFNKVAQELGAAMTGIGMCNLINHGIDKKRIETIYELSRTFFQLPTEIKMKYRKASPKKSFHGYAGPGDELLNEEQKNSTELREFFDIWGFEAFDEKNFPEEVPGFKAACDALRRESEETGKKVLRCLEIYLKLDDGFLLSRHKNLGDASIKTQTQMRSLYYYTLNPNDNIPPNSIRCGEHSDWGTITFLNQDMVGGLEVKTAEGEWIEAAPVEDAILMNSGQLLEYWTGGHFHAAPHRVRILTEGRITKDPRQSFIHFINPDGDAKVYPIVPVLPKKEAQFAKYNNATLVAYDHYQRLIEDATTHY